MRPVRAWRSADRSRTSPCIRGPSRRWTSNPMSFLPLPPVPAPGRPRRHRPHGAVVFATAVAVTLAVGVAGPAGLVTRSAVAQTTDPTLDTHPTLVPPEALTTTSTTADPGADPSTTTTTTTPGTEPDPDTPPPIIDSRLSPELANVAVEAPDYNDARAAYATAWRHQVDAGLRQRDARAQIGDLSAPAAGLQGELNENERRHAKSATRLAALRQGIQDLAVASYVRSGSAGASDLG